MPAHTQQNGYHQNDDDVVITGISGKFPESNNMEEFKRNLFDGVDMVTDDERRWPTGNNKTIVKVIHIYILIQW